MVNISPEPATRQPSKTSLRALDTANFFLADVRDGLGPYLAIYLLTTLHWQAQDIGIAMSAMGIATVVAQTPAGALVDRTHRKHVYSIIASLLIALAAIITITLPTYPVIMGGQAIMGRPRWLSSLWAYYGFLYRKRVRRKAKPFLATYNFSFYN